jgi:hypothetical protein
MDFSLISFSGTLMYAILSRKRPYYKYERNWQVQEPILRGERLSFKECQVEDDNLEILFNRIFATEPG